MTTLAHPVPGGSADTCSSGRALLERAVAAAPSHVPPPRGLRRLLASDRSAAALIRRYRLWPAIERSHQRVTREFGRVEVEVSAEDCYGTEFVMVIFLCDCLDFDRMIAFSDVIGEEQRALLGERRWFRLVTGVEPGECELSR